MCYVVNVLSQFMIQPRQTHWIAVTHVLTYLQGTVEIWPEICLHCRLELCRDMSMQIGQEA
jgi:hypothetical protein